MSPDRVERKLSAILSADVKGYSRLMSYDEEATIRTLAAYRSVMADLIEEHRGRVVDTPGDNLLAEFPSVVDAVQSAVEVQKELKIRNAELPGHRRMEFRIGINLGDVIVEGERIYGDGVNIAARLEGLADPGGVCISGTVYEQVENKLDLEFEFTGEQAVKNIARPVRSYRVKMEPGAAVGQPTSFAEGRYEVRKFLGEGGKKKVYLAHDTLLDREVAFALIKTEGLDEALTISRELGMRPLMERILSRKEILNA